MIEKALAMALRAHAGQIDKAGQPYILHPLRVAAKFGDKELLYVIALLHDVVEDTFGKPNEITISEILSEFGGMVAEAVECLTRREVGMLYLAINMSLTPWSWDIKRADKKEVYLMEFIPRVATNAVAIAVKIADIHDNLDPRRMLALNDEEIGRLKRYYRALKFLQA